MNSTIIDRERYLSGISTFEKGEFTHAINNRIDSSILARLIRILTPMILPSANRPLALNCVMVELMLNPRIVVKRPISAKKIAYIPRPSGPRIRVMNIPAMIPRIWVGICVRNVYMLLRVILLNGFKF